MAFATLQAMDELSSLTPVEQIEIAVLEKADAIAAELEGIQQSLEQSFDTEEGDVWEWYDARMRDLNRRKYLYDLQDEVHRSVAVFTTWRIHYREAINERLNLEDQWDTVSDVGYGSARLDTINAQLGATNHRIQRLLIPEQTVFAWKRSLDILMNDLQWDSHRYGIEPVDMMSFDYIIEKRRIEDSVIRLLQISPDDVTHVRPDTLTDFERHRWHQDSSHTRAA